MPSRNVEKIYLENSYYHIFNRSVDRIKIFKDAEDKTVFLNLLKRYLSDKPARDRKGRDYTQLYNKLELLAFCLMGTHYHMLIYQYSHDAMTKLMRGVATSYTAYFNKKYKRIGPLFQDRFKASLVSRDEYILHISRYIHLNPTDYEKYEWSSLPYYLHKKSASWIRPNRVLQLFEEDEYAEFVSDYADHKAVLDVIKSELANA